MIDDIKDGKAKICFSRAIGAIDNTILNDIIFDCIEVKTEITVLSEIQFYLLLEPTEIFYGKSRFGITKKPMPYDTSLA